MLSVRFLRYWLFTLHQLNSNKSFSYKHVWSEQTVIFFNIIRYWSFLCRYGFSPSCSTPPPTEVTLAHRLRQYHDRLHRQPRPLNVNGCPNRIRGQITRVVLLWKMPLRENIALAVYRSTTRLKATDREARACTPTAPNPLNPS